MSDESAAKTVGRVLLVDDEAMVRTLLSQTLEAEGFEVVVACDGKEASRIVESQEFDLVVSDINMPECDGVKLSRYLQMAEIPVILITGKATKENILAAAQAGNRDIFVKGSMDMSVLIDKIKRKINPFAVISSQNVEAVAGNGGGSGPDTPSSVPGDSGQTGSTASNGEAATVSGPLTSPKPGVVLEQQPRLLSREAFDEHLAEMQDVKALPFVALELIKLTQDPNVGSQDLVKVIERDQAITSKLLRMANSNTYRTRKRATTLEQAVINIGSKGIRELALGVALVEHYDSEVEGIDRVELWKHSIATAVIARRIAQHNEYEEVEKAFLAGLLHDIGKVLMIEHFPDVYGQTVTFARENGIHLIDVENQFIGFDHAQCSRLVMGSWGLPDDLFDAIAYHHYPFAKVNNLRSKDRDLMHTVAVANHIANAWPCSEHGVESLRHIDPGLAEFIGAENPEVWAQRMEGVAREIKDLELILLMHGDPGSTSVQTLFDELVDEVDRKRMYIYGARHDVINVMALRYGCLYHLYYESLEEPQGGDIDVLAIYADTADRAKRLATLIQGIRQERRYNGLILALVPSVLKPQLPAISDPSLVICETPVYATAVDATLHAHGLLSHHREN